MGSYHAALDDLALKIILFLRFVDFAGRLRIS
jgi:hypothetical protein